jgi:V/A-type H+-transporting ATPase subunit A
VLESGLGARLLRLGQVPPPEMARAGEALRAEIGDSLARLEAE